MSYEQRRYLKYTEYVSQRVTVSLNEKSELKDYWYEQTYTQTTLKTHIGIKDHPSCSEL